MPIPNSSRASWEFVPIQILDEVFLAKIDRSTRFSFIKRSTVLELEFSSDHSLILLPVSCGKIRDFVIFEQREELPEEIIVGNYAVEVLKVDRVNS